MLFLNFYQQKFTDRNLTFWKEKNERSTKTSCEEQLTKLKSDYLDPVLRRIGSADGSAVSFTDIMQAWNKITKDYNEKARGAQNVKAAVFLTFNQVSNSLPKGWKIFSELSKQGQMVKTFLEKSEIPKTVKFPKRETF